MGPHDGDELIQYDYFHYHMATFASDELAHCAVQYIREQEEKIILPSCWLRYILAMHKIRNKIVLVSITQHHSVPNHLRTILSHSIVTSSTSSFY